MLKPADLTALQYPVALKPAVGYEQQLYVSTQQFTNLGTIEVVAPNSGTYTPSLADNVELALVPQELLAMLNTDVDLGGVPLTVTVNGLDSNSNPVSGTAVFQPPGYSLDQNFSFPKGWSHEITTTGTAGKKWKQVLSVSIAYAGTATPEILILGFPSLDNTVTGTFVKIGTKVSLNLDPKVPMPVAIQDGRDKGAYIKSGEIDIGTVDITAKVPDGSDGLARYNGRRVTGWVREMKEDKLLTQNILLGGLIMTAKSKVGESIEPITLDATGMAEKYAFIMAH